MGSRLRELGDLGGTSGASRIGGGVSRLGGRIGTLGGAGRGILFRRVRGLSSGIGDRSFRFGLRGI